MMNNLVNVDKFKHVMIEFQKADKYKRGHMTFIKLALTRMAEFHLSTDLLTYNRLLDLFPKGKYNNKTLLDAVWPRPHPQIDLALKVLQMMEENGVRPNNVTYSVLVDVFGRDSLPVEKCKRIAYWFDKYENADPYHIAGLLPESPEELGSLIISRITSDHVDITIHKSSDEDCIVSGVVPYMKEWATMSQGGKQLLLISGPHRLWMKKTQQNYYTLSHQPKCGVCEGVLAVAYIVPSDLEHLQKWLKHLQASHTKLKDSSIVFDVTSHAHSHSH